METASGGCPTGVISLGHEPVMAEDFQRAPTGARRLPVSKAFASSDARKS